MWDEEENLKISSTPNLALSHDEAAVVLHNPALVWCSTCAVAPHSTEEMQHFHQQTGSFKLFSIMCFFFFCKFKLFQ